MKNNKLWNYMLKDNAAAVAYLVATVIYCVYQFYAALNGYVIYGVMMMGLNFVFAFQIVPFVIAALLCAAIAVVFRMFGIKNGIVVAVFGFAISNFIVGLVATVLEVPDFIKISSGAILTYAIFAGTAWLGGKITAYRILQMAIVTVALGSSLYYAPILVRSIGDQRTLAKTDKSYKDAVEQLSFTPYYPTYSSSIYPASAAKLNGFSGYRYANEKTVTFRLGRFGVKQGAYLDGQDKIMNFVDNCSISSIWFDMEYDTSVRQGTIDHGLKYPQKCDLIRTTPTGKEVYAKESASEAWFYIKLGQTNVIMWFDDMSRVKYEPSHRDEILKIIDSLQPLDKSKLERGNSFGLGLSP